MTSDMVVSIPGLKLPNPANGSHRHWRAAASEASKQRRAARLALLPLARRWLKEEPRWPVAVVVTRCSAGTLDAHDGLPGACKHVVDEIAFALGIRDNDSRVSWSYRQEKCPRGTASVRIALTESELTSSESPL